MLRQVSGWPGSHKEQYGMEIVDFEPMGGRVKNSRSRRLPWKAVGRTEWASSRPICSSRKKFSLDSKGGRANATPTWMRIPKMWKGRRSRQTRFRGRSNATRGSGIWCWTHILNSQLSLREACVTQSLCIMPMPAQNLSIRDLNWVIGQVKLWSLAQRWTPQVGQGVQVKGVDFCWSN